MKNIIIGTAGHVDHGKTELIRALTGIDTDWHKEEKERGISIELGFAYITFADGQRCGIIDVPGHEKFVRNMLAGAGSIDLALFVVACDEGIMPQSREHLEILSLLSIKQGIIVLTKTDLAENDEWIEMVALDIKEEVKDTFLKDAPIVPVSSKTGAGIDDLKMCIRKFIDDAEEMPDYSPARLPVDRVFTKDGFGTVVTGTLISGTIAVGDELEVYPAVIKAKVRNIQVHGDSVPKAHKSQRVAINLSGLKGEVTKGCVLAEPDSIRNTKILDVRLDIVKSTKRKIKNGSQLHFYYGTGEAMCRLVLLEKNELSGGESGFAQLHFKDDVSVKNGDHFVVRFFSPAETVGGGIVLDSNPKKRKRSDEGCAELFACKEKGSLIERISCFVYDKSSLYLPVAEIKRNIFAGLPDFDGELKRLVDIGQVHLIKDSVIHNRYFEEIAHRCKVILEQFHEKNPLLEGIRRDELKSKLQKWIPSMVSEDFLLLLERYKKINSHGATVSDAGFKVMLSESQQKLREEVLSVFFQAGFSPPSHEEITQRYSKDQKTLRQSIDSLIAAGTLIALTPQIFIHQEFYDRGFDIFAGLAAKGNVTLSEFRDAISSSRKYALAILEHFDAKGLTKQQGDYRILAKK